MRRLLFIFISILPLFTLNAQNPGGVYNPGNYVVTLDELYRKFYKKPTKLDSIVNPEAVTAKRIWRIIDFSIPDNKNIFSMQLKGTGSVPLFEIILYGLYSGKIHAYKKDSWNNLTPSQQIFKNDLGKIIFYTDSLIEKEFDSEGNEHITRKLKTDTITSLKLKGFVLGEDWYMDKHFSRIEKRIFAICPVWYNEKLQKDVPLFWLYYPECRDLFSSFQANNPINNDTKVTWDEVLLNKWFIGLIVKKSNIFDRNLNSYRKGEDILIESYKTKEDLLNKEYDFFDQ